MASVNRDCFPNVKFLRRVCVCVCVFKCDYNTCRRTIRHCRRHNIVAMYSVIYNPTATTVTDDGEILFFSYPPEYIIFYIFVAGSIYRTKLLTPVRFKKNLLFRILLLCYIYVCNTYLTFIVLINHGI